MPLLLLIFVLLSRLLLPTPQPSTSLRLVIQDAEGAPVANLLVYVSSGYAVDALTTDANGALVVADPRGETVIIRSAQTAEGRTVTIEPNTRTRTLELKLIPHGERTVHLILAEMTLFLAPDEIFRGTAPEAPSAALPPSLAAGTPTPTVYAPVTPTSLGATARREPTLAPLDAAMRDRLNEPETRATLEACASSSPVRSQARCAAVLRALDAPPADQAHTGWVRMRNTVVLVLLVLLVIFVSTCCWRRYRR